MFYLDQEKFHALYGEFIGKELPYLFVWIFYFRVIIQQIITNVR